MAVTAYFPVLAFLLAGVILTIKAGKLTFAGAIAAAIAGLLVFAGAGYTGLIMLTTFFILGTIATSWKKKEKLPFKSSGDRSTKRNAGQVLANGGIPALVGLLMLLIPSQATLFGMMMAAALASATADTLSSELGMIYGRRFFNIITLRKEAKGLDGVISIEGLVIGIIGSAIIAVIYGLGYGWDKACFFIIIAGTLGNVADSVLGALLERKNYLNNDAVNFLNTLIAALSALLLLTFTR